MNTDFVPLFFVIIVIGAASIFTFLTFNMPMLVLSIMALGAIYAGVMK